MGLPKADLPFGDATFLAAVLDAVRTVAPDDVVVSCRASTADALRRAGVGRLAIDGPSGRGPLAGIIAGLRAARHELVLTVGVDMPFLSPALLGELVRIARAGPQDATVPRSASGLEPLHAVYRRGPVLAAAERLAREGVHELHALLRDPALALREVSAAEAAAFDPDGLSAFNANTPEDLERARALLAERRR